ncbi:hypothetical protein [Kibdelosporangium aridum]|uniref:hypothetical protein n=1 Tax=Kibdelosporangium aridum TaxID=2030 RepID=UPI0035ED11A8
MVTAAAGARSGLVYGDQRVGGQHFGDRLRQIRVGTGTSDPRPGRAEQLPESPQWSKWGDHRQIACQQQHLARDAEPARGQRGGGGDHRPPQQRLAAGDLGKPAGDRRG